MHSLPLVPPEISHPAIMALIYMEMYIKKISFVSFFPFSAAGILPSWSGDSSLFHLVVLADVDKCLRRHRSNPTWNYSGINIIGIGVNAVFSAMFAELQENRGLVLFASLWKDKNTTFSVCFPVNLGWTLLLRAPCLEHRGVPQWEVWSHLQPTDVTSLWGDSLQRSICPLRD